MFINHAHVLEVPIVRWNIWSSDISFDELIDESLVDLVSILHPFSEKGFTTDDPDIHAATEDLQGFLQGVQNLNSMVLGIYIASENDVESVSQWTEPGRDTHPGLVTHHHSRAFGEFFEPLHILRDFEE